ncbi:MAG: hypothetical protein RL716_574 [Actinomycetota bacterium]|jgi:hypothetical protein|uniref:hypothetical protein n=1 Tax=Rhodoluna sp. TaxID=1969481 RepID=UPI0025ED7B6E|nr:hypothetical protein [Rhodoluna sp.]
MGKKFEAWSTIREILARETEFRRSDTSEFAQPIEEPSSGKLKNSKIGKMYFRVTSKIDALRIGKFRYGWIIRRSAGFLLLIGGFSLMNNFIATFGETQFEYALTQEQKDQGYEYVCVSRKCSNTEDIAYRFFNEEEAALAPRCDNGVTCSDIKVIPLNESCPAITVKINYFETDSWFATPSDSVTKKFENVASGLYLLGHEYDLRLETSTTKANYESIEDAYCTY